MAKRRPQSDQKYFLSLSRSFPLKLISVESLSTLFGDNLRDKAHISKGEEHGGKGCFGLIIGSSTGSPNGFRGRIGISRVARLSSAGKGQEGENRGGAGFGVLVPKHFFSFGFGVDSKKVRVFILSGR